MPIIRQGTEGTPNGRHLFLSQKYTRLKSIQWTILFNSLSVSNDLSNFLKDFTRDLTCPSVRSLDQLGCILMKALNLKTKDFWSKDLTTFQYFTGSDLKRSRRFNWYFIYLFILVFSPRVILFQETLTFSP